MGGEGPGAAGDTRELGVLQKAVEIYGWIEAQGQAWGTRGTAEDCGGLRVFVRMGLLWLEGGTVRW